MGVHLERIEIKRFRGIKEYNIDNLGRWSSITGPNSTSKSSIINAISFLGSSRMHEVSDIPSWIKPTDVNLLEVPIEITYLFRLNKSFEKLMSDSRVVEALVPMYEIQLERIPENNATDPYRSSLKKALTSLKIKTPLGNTLRDALYKTLRHDVEPHPKHRPYQPLFHSNGELKMPEEIFRDSKFLNIIFRLTLSNGPEISFSLLDERKNSLVADETFIHLLHHQDAIDSEISLAYVIGVVFIKSIIGIPLNNTEINIPQAILAQDGSNTRQYIEYCLAHHPNILENVAENFKRVFGQPIQLKKASLGSSIEENEILVKIEENIEWFSIGKLSDGMFHVLRILLQLASSKKGDIIIIDEPELHLHPGAARCLKEILHEKCSEIQIICTTHSPVFIDPSITDIIILNQNIDGYIKPKVLDAKEVDIALAELGSSGLDSLLFDVVIWVEGPSDKVYMEKWLHLLRNEFKNINNSQIGILPYGGKSMINYLNIEEIKLINRKSAFVIDSDKKSRSDEIEPHISHFISQCNKNGIYCWKTKRRSIENYIPIDVLEKKLNLESGMLSISQYDDVIEKLKEVGRNYDKGKVKLAKTVTPSITIEHIKQDKEFYNELKNLIKNLNTET